MRFRMAVVLVIFLMLCVMFAAQSAKADTLSSTGNNFIINDLGDTITVTDMSSTGRVSLTSIGGLQACGALNVEFCTFALNAPTGTHVDTGSSSIPSVYLLSEPGTFGVPLSCTGGPLQSSGCVSDGLASVSVPPVGTVGALISLTFHSDPSAANGQEVPVAPCPPVIGCSRDEDGTPQLVDVVHWSDGTIDNIYVKSDAGVGVEPEPASLILFGSGLAIAGGFLRRRRRAVTPSVVA
jgi:PEP-CTERM motif